MILVTFRDAPSPLPGNVKGVVVVRDVEAPLVCAALSDAVRRFANERDAFLFVAPGGRVATARVWPVLRTSGWDVAAFVDRIGKLPKRPGIFSGIGRVSLQTILIRPTEAGRRLLARWAERVAVRPGNEAVELAIALVETGTAF